jgi:hypothetical protein
MAITSERVREIFKGLETGHYLSKKAFIEGTFAKLAQVLPQGTLLITEHVIVQDDQAVVELYSLATPKNGMRFDNRYCWVLFPGRIDCTC